MFDTRRLRLNGMGRVLEIEVEVALLVDLGTWGCATMH